MLEGLEQLRRSMSEISAPGAICNTRDGMIADIRENVEMSSRELVALNMKISVLEMEAEKSRFELERANKQLEAQRIELEEERRRAEKAERNSWKISLFITLTGALFSAIFSVIAGIFFN